MSSLDFTSATERSSKIKLEIRMVNDVITDHCTIIYLVLKTRVHALLALVARGGTGTILVYAAPLDEEFCLKFILETTDIEHSRPVSRVRTAKPSSIPV